MLLACILLALGGIACNVAGALLNYGPLYTVGGISIGFAVGCYLTRRAALEAVRCVCGHGEAEDDRGAVLRCPVHGQRDGTKPPIWDAKA